MSAFRGGRPVVAGVGRSATALRAAHWAADEAVRRGVPLRMVHALEWPPGSDPHPAVDHPERTWSAHYRAAGEAVLREAADEVRRRRPEADVETLLADGSRAAVLRAQGDEAALLVIGAKRLAAEDVLTTGNLGVALTSHAGCPVAVVRVPEHVTHEPPLVVVGVDGSENCRDAVAVAFEEAALRGARLLAVEARQHVGRPLAESRNRELEERVRADLSEATAGWQEKYPEVEVRHEVLPGKPAQVLLREAAHARCLVVGTRGLGGFRGLLLGSVSHVLLHHAACPLIVVPPRTG
ncbi:universal stress protein [Streptacidiphilus sp. ASG 303]|uniref:universal stress protein n=1 Tax=Streptacidiphilus sp. ASG 303 TaxID=2896847 RepID=UPI001E54AE8E|nr:universal stress protein [Streptacidiphilus sp. ASG 303]MCD0484503.1 universal stress protein [Streptacidiphilus sp. ASG 303]